MIVLNFNTGLTADWFLQRRQALTRLVRGIGGFTDSLDRVK